jgi:hypothetical protein
LAKETHEQKKKNIQCQRRGGVEVVPEEDDLLKEINNLVGEER